ncbi:hypothetical protein ZWY2020_053263 [Hordeum vulgare]|nr:hypothetical protein ZWY2020_053263 [Hordeum vulgare]
MHAPSPHTHVSYRRSPPTSPIHTPELLRLSSAAGLLPAASGAVSDVVVRVLDTGIYPLNRGSFKPAGDGLGPPPSSFSGDASLLPPVDGAGFSRSHLSTEKYPSAVQPELPRRLRNPHQATEETLDPIRALAIAGSPVPLPFVVHPEPSRCCTSPFPHVNPTA